MTGFILHSNVPAKGIILDMSLKNLGDVKVECDKKSYNLPYNILHNEMRYFDSFKDEFNAGQTIYISNLIDSRTFETMLQYHGFGPISIDDSNIIQLLKGCIFFGDKTVLNKCIVYIHSQISVEKLDELIENIIDYVKLNIIIQTCNLYCKENIKHLLDDDHIHKLSKKSLRYILCLNDLKIEDETYLANQVLKYYNANSHYHRIELDEWFESVKTKINWGECNEEQLISSNARNLLTVQDKRNIINKRDKSEKKEIIKKTKQVIMNGIFKSYDSNDRNVEFIVNNKSFYVIENVIKYRNSFLYSFIEANMNNIQNNKIIVNLPVCQNNDKGFEQLMILYGYGSIKVDTSNILNLMCACIELKDNSFNKSFAEYFNKKINIELLNLYLLDHNKYRNYYKEVEEIIKKYAYKNVMDITRNAVLSPESMKELLSFTLLYVPQEQQLANNIVAYINFYNRNGKINDDNYHFFYEILELINWKDVQILQLDHCPFLREVDLTNLHYNEDIIHVRNNSEYEIEKKTYKITILKEKIKKVLVRYAIPYGAAFIIYSVVV